MSHARGFRIGIDVGGTFTDLFVVADGGEARTCKVLSTPEDPSEGVLDGLAAVAKEHGLGLRELAQRLRLVVHGTTVTTNATLTRGGARTGLITTEGVRDALEMRRGVRERQYDNRSTNVVPLVPRTLRLPVRGRLDFRGREVTPLSRDDVRAAAARFRDEGVEAVAVCFLHSYADDRHEREACETLRQELPHAWISASSGVVPTIRFYDRVSTTALDAYVGPVLGAYLGRLSARLAEAGFEGVLLIMQSNGGVAVPEAVRARPSMTLLSGPAAGPRAAATYAAEAGHRDCVLVDMGGTSFDASLVRGGAAALGAGGEVDRLRIALPMLEITTIGAGGGSIGWLDAGGLLRVGPASAGAKPGPACYGRGGVLPTCTDADLVLGYLDPAFFAGGDLPLDELRARDALRIHLAEPLGLSVERAAAGMYAVINANMAHGVREVTVQRGLDPREFPLVVAGGAGPLHACEIARELGMRTLIVPPTASTLCAAGMLLSDLQHDAVRTWMAPLDDVDLHALGGQVEALAAEAEAQLRDEGARGADHRLALDLRYRGQYHEVTVSVDRADLAPGGLPRIAAAFHGEHDRLYGYELAGAGTPLELIHVRLRSVGRGDRPSLPRVLMGSGDPSRAVKGARPAWVPGRERFDELTVYDGHRLLAGDTIPGPALVERVDTTLLVGEGFTATVDTLGSLVVRREEPSRG